MQERITPLTTSERCLVAQWTGLVDYIIKKHDYLSLARKARLSREQLHSAGCLGMIHAAKRFEPGRSKFNTFAYAYIRSWISREIVLSRLIRVPEAVAWDVKQGRRADALPDVHQFRGDHDDWSYDPPAPDETAEREARDFQREFRDQLALLPARWQSVIKGRLEGRTLEAIGRDMGVSKERIRQIEFRAGQAIAAGMGLEVPRTNRTRNYA